MIFELQMFLDKSCNVQYLFPRIPEFMNINLEIWNRFKILDRDHHRWGFWCEKRNPRSWASCRWSTGCSDWPLCRLQAHQSDINGLLVWWWSLVICNCILLFSIFTFPHHNNFHHPVHHLVGITLTIIAIMTIMVIIAIIIMTIMVPTVTNDDFSPLHTQLPSWQGLPAARCLSPKNRVHPKTWSKSKWLWLGRNDQPHLTDQWTTSISFASIFPLFPPGANETLC